MAEHQAEIDRLITAWRLMSLIRAFETGLERASADGEIAGYIHLATGQEAIAAAVHMHLRSCDWIASTHRCHGHALAAGCDIKRICKEIFGRAGGLSNGRGGSQHLIDFDCGFLGGNGIVGAGIGLAAGAALTARRRRQDAVGVAFIGDGACQQGIVHEVLNLAAVMGLPLVTVIENNGWAQSTPLTSAAANPALAERAAALGLEATVVDGLDFFALDAAMESAFSSARLDNRPFVVEARQVRQGGHYAGDPQKYRIDTHAPAEDADCLAVFRRRAGKFLAKARLDQIAAEAAAQAAEAIAAARQASWPDPSGRQA